MEGWNAQLSLMTGMAAAQIMIDGGVGILRTMPAPEPQVIARFRLQTIAFGWPWAPGLAYGEYLRTLRSDDPRQLAIAHAAGSLFRRAAYTVFDGSAPDAVASRLDRGSIDAVEAAVLRGRAGEVFDATVISARKGGRVIQLVHPAVAAECTGPLTVGSRVRVTLVTADIPTSSVRFSANG